MHMCDPSQSKQASFRPLLENWLQKQVGPAYDALKKDPSRAVSAGDVRAALAAEHEETSSKR